MSLFKRKSKSSPAEEAQEGPYGGMQPSWYRSLPGDVYKKWPKNDGEPEKPVFLTHCSSIDMEDEMLVNMLEAYGIPAIKLYPGQGSFGAVVLGMSGEGSDIFVPESLREDALSLMDGGEEND